ncbi:unnamed protein product, partial [Rotaria sordida]
KFQRNLNLTSNTKWIQNGITVAGGNLRGNAMNQLSGPQGLCVDDDQTIYIADYNNHRIMEWKCGATTGRVVAGGNGKGNRPDQLRDPTDVIIDKEGDSLIICDYFNRRVVRWSRQNGRNGETIISNVGCYGLTMDNDGFLYVVDSEKHEVKRYRMGESEGEVVAGGNGQGDRLNQLDEPSYIFIDKDHSLYVSEWGNHRVMKWSKDAKEGIVVAGGQGQGRSLAQLSYPYGIFVDESGAVYVVDCSSHRIVRWIEGDAQGSVIVGGNDEGKQSNQLSTPVGLSVDREGNLYVIDNGNERVQRFSIEKDDKLMNDAYLLCDRN